MGLAITLITSIFLTFSTNISAKNTIEVIADINDQVITDLDLRKRYKFFIKTSNIKINSDSEKTLISNQLLEKLIDENIQNQNAKKLNISLSEEELDKTLEEIASAQNFKNKKELISHLKQNNISYQEYRNQIKSQILWKKIITKKIQPRIIISESDIDEMIELKKINAKTTNLKLSEIFIPFKNKQEEKDSLILINKLAAEVQNKNNNFHNIARQFSKGIANSSDQEIGWIEESSLHPKIFKEIKNLKINDVSNPVKLSNGYYIFKIIDKNTIKNLEKEDENKIRQIIFYKKLTLDAKKYLSKIKKEAYIRIR
jgi:peptidyl-prolyl cis-trans isomerase SurA